MIKAAFVVFAPSLLLFWAAQQADAQITKGVIYGTVTDSDGNAAKGINLRAQPIGVALLAALPETRTDQSGRYEFERVPWYGRYTVYAEDLNAGYSNFSTGPAGRLHPVEVTISPEHPKSALNLQLPPKAGFLHIHLTNETNGS